MFRHIALLPIYLCLFIGLPMIALATPIHEIELQTNIHEVTVYQDRALVVRKGQISLSAGITELLISALPQRMDDRFVQTSASGDEALLLDTRIERGQPAHAEPERLKVLQQRLDTLQAELAGFKDKARVHQQRSDFLARIESAITQIKPDPNALPDPASWEGYLNFFSTEWVAILAHQRHVQADIRKLEQEIREVQAAISDFGRAQQHPSKTARVRVHSPQGGELTLHIAYLVSGVAWTPSYDIRVSEQDQSLSLQYRAVVRQQTGEDWLDAKLTLSTAQPALDSTPPALTTWWISPQEPIALQSRARTMEMMAPAPAMSQDGMLAEAAPEVGTAKAEITRGLTATSFVIKAPTTIPADNTPQTVTIDEHQLRGEFRYVIVPARSQHAFLQIETQYEGEAVLLPGLASIFHGSMLVGRAQLPLLSPGEYISLPLGVSDAIKVERRMTRRFVENTGILGRKNRRITHAYQTTIENHTLGVAEILVRDQIPVATDERIRIHLRHPSEDHRVADKPGELSWEFTLAAGEKKELPLVFVIEHPEDLSISGL